MLNVVVFSQNIKLDSLMASEAIPHKGETVFLTPHMLFANERKLISEHFEKCIFVKFADLLSDEEAEKCDIASYDKTFLLSEYYQEIKKKKNTMILNKLSKQFTWENGYICSNDLGIHSTTWLNAGFIPVDLEYYYDREPIYSKEPTGRSFLKTMIKRLPGVMKYRNNLIQKGKEKDLPEEVYKSEYSGKKLIFIGKLSRISYRMDLDWEQSAADYNNLVNGIFENKTKSIYLTTIHEHFKSPVPDSKEYDVRIIQDGYLPPNYSSVYLKYKQMNERYYAWDVLGEKLFRNHQVPVSLMPFRKKLLLPYPEFRDKVKTILVATSGPGDWTALKNRSDEDLMVEAFVELAKRFPDINIIYRCHPTWTHPDHNGVNSINRVSDYIKYSKLSNITISGNIPQNKEYKTLSFSRNSFEEDLEKADVVFGEHSVSMLDGGFFGLPFCSVNLTGRRDFYCGITEMGFPHCESIDEICEFLYEYEDKEFQKKYNAAVDVYNAMTEAE